MALQLKYDLLTLALILALIAIIVRPSLSLFQAPFAKCLCP